MTTDEIIDKDEVLKMARQAGFHEHDFPFKKFKFEAFAKLVADVATAKERESCAKVCEYRQDGYELSGFTREFTAARACAKAIRARGEA